MAKERYRASSRGAKRSATEVPSISETPSKRRKRKKDNEETLPVPPARAASHERSAVASGTVELIKSSSQAEFSSDHGAANVLAELLALPPAVTRQVYKHENDATETIPNTLGGKEQINEPSSLHKTFQESAFGNADATTLKSPSVLHDSHERIIPSRLCQSQRSYPTLFRWFVSVGIILFFVIDIYRSSSRHSFSDGGYQSNQRSNSTAMPILPASLNESMIRIPQKTTTLTCSWHLLELDDYERQKTELSKMEKELAQALAELAKANSEIIAARMDASKANDAYRSIFSELGQTKHELVESQQKLELALREIDYTREELDRTRWELTASNAELKTFSRHLTEAYEDIDELCQLIELQEQVAINALNFVATTAVKEQHQTGSSRGSLEFRGASGHETKERGLRPVRRYK